MSLRKIGTYAGVLYHWRVRGTERLPYVPEDISVELTNTCNFKCSFCPQSDPRHFDRVTRTTLSVENADRLLARLREGGVRTDVIHWTLDGEPFVNRDIDAICRVAMAHGFRQFIFATNGFFLSPDRLAALPREGARYSLGVDFCADREYFETCRGTRTSWERVRDNLIVASRDPELAHIDFRVTDITSYTERDPGVVKANLAALRDLFPTGRITVRSRVFHNMTGHVEGIRQEKEAGNPGYHRCPYPWTSLVVASNGDAVACCRDLDHKTVLGNLFDQDLDSVWNGEVARGLRRNLAGGRPEAMAACANCDMPYDGAKFTPRNLQRTAVNRLGIFR